MKPCPKCDRHLDERSIVVKVYKGSKRVEYCINKGCGYRLALPQIKELRNEVK